MSVIASVVLAGCTPLFHADFEDDTAFEEPNLNPPGPPSGDKIVLFDAVNSNFANSAYDVRPDSLDGNSLRMVAAPNSKAQARMQSDGNGDPERPIDVSFTGRLLPGSNGKISIKTGGSSIFALQITLVDGDITVNGIHAGNYAEGGQHNMQLAMFPASDTFGLLFTGSVLFGNSITGSLNKPDDFPGDDYTLVLEVLSSPDGGTYLVDNVNISSRD